MFFRIDSTSDSPLFAQLAASVRAEAAQGRIAAGERLPAARDVAESLSVNMHTVLRAYQDLRDEGLIELRRGRGATVTVRAERYRHIGRAALELDSTARHYGLSPEALAALARRLAAEERPDAERAGTAERMPQTREDTP